MINQRVNWSCNKQLRELEAAFKSVNQALKEAEAGLDSVPNLPSSELPKKVLAMHQQSLEPEIFGSA